MFRICLLLAFFLLCTPQVSGQADSILTLPNEIQYEALWKWYDTYPQSDSTRMKEVLQKMRTDFKNAGADELEAETWWLWYYYLTGRFYAYKDTFADILDAAAKYAINQDWQVQLAELRLHKAFMYLDLGRTVAAFENIMAAQELMRKLGFEKFPRIYSALLLIGNAYMNINDYQRAIPYLREAMTHPPKIHDPIFRMSLMNAIGICYMRLIEYDSAIISYQQAHEAAKEIKHEFWTGLTGGNLGYVHYLKGDMDIALPLLTEDFNISVKHGQIGSAINASLSLASIHLQKGDQGEAEKYIEFFTKHIDRKDDHAMQIFYENLYLLEKLKGNYLQATIYSDSAKVYREKYESQRDKTILERAKLQLEMTRHSDELRHLEMMRKRQLLIRNMLLAFTILGGLIAFLIINRGTLKRKKELELAKAELAHYTSTIREKNELIDSFTDEIEKMRASEQFQNDERMEHLTQLMEASILTEEDWKHFRSMFDKVHPGFFTRLKTKMPDLTPAETRLLALTKLKLATREMASMLGISYESMKKTRQRLRKKINLPEDGSLEEVAELI